MICTRPPMVDVITVTPVTLTWGGGLLVVESPGAEYSVTTTTIATTTIATSTTATTTTTSTSTITITSANSSSRRISSRP